MFASPSWVHDFQSGVEVPIFFGSSRLLTSDFNSVHSVVQTHFMLARDLGIPILLFTNCGPESKPAISRSVQNPAQ